VHFVLVFVLAAPSPPRIEPVDDIEALSVVNHWQLIPPKRIDAVPTPSRGTLVEEYWAWNAFDSDVDTQYWWPLRESMHVAFPVSSPQALLLNLGCVGQPDGDVEIEVTIEERFDGHIIPVRSARARLNVGASSKWFVIKPTKRREQNYKLTEYYTGVSLRVIRADTATELCVNELRLVTASSRPLYPKIAQHIGALREQRMTKLANGMPRVLRHLLRDPLTTVEQSRRSTRVSVDDMPSVAQLLRRLRVADAPHAFPDTSYYLPDFVTALFHGRRQPFEPASCLAKEENAVPLVLGETGSWLWSLNDVEIAAPVATLRANCRPVHTWNRVHSFRYHSSTHMAQTTLGRLLCTSFSHAEPSSLGSHGSQESWCYHYSKSGELQEAAHCNRGDIFGDRCTYLAPVRAGGQIVALKLVEIGRDSEPGQRRGFVHGENQSQEEGRAVHATSIHQGVDRRARRPSPKVGSTPADDAGLAHQRRECAAAA
jgi:hypothetical protein